MSSALTEVTQVADEPKISSQRKWNDANPKARWAHASLRSALKKGLITKGACDVCGDPETDGHHDDYDRPADVRWLCRLHHRHEHRKPKGGAE